DRAHRHVGGRATALATPTPAARRALRRADAGQQGAAEDQDAEHARADALDHPFTAPAVSPRTMCFWNSRRSTRIGSAARIAAAKPRLSWSTFRAARPFRAIWTVSHRSSVVTTRGQMYWFQADRNATSVKLAI